LSGTQNELKCELERKEVECRCKGSSGQIDLNTIMRVCLGVYMCVVAWRSERRRCGRMGLEFSTNEDPSELESVELDVNQWLEQPLHLYSY